MTPVDELLSALEKAYEKLPQTTINQAAKYEPEIIDLNTDQLFSGLDANGNPVTPNYSTLTISIKRQKGQPTNRVTLRDTGEFYRDFEVRFFNDYFAIFSNDDKTEKLERKYGKDIFGLTNQNILEVAELVKPDLQETFGKQVLV